MLDTYKIDKMNSKHSFHIPVMGTGFTLETPIKVAPFGIDSVISIVDDVLIEKVRKMYADKFEMPYKDISSKMEDFRAKRITSYLNLVNEIAKTKFEALKNFKEDTIKEIEHYLSLMPNASELKSQFHSLTSGKYSIQDVKAWLQDNLKMGSIDVNIMTKLDKANYKDGELLPAQYNDAHAALRGFAMSDLESGVVFSAGMNPRLYSYLEEFEDFFPEENGMIKKKIILKVSDYRSALIQGKFLAKKGLWVSEYRIESGLNCGGHAFATEGYLMGPILQEFKEKRKELIESTWELLIKSLQDKGRVVPESIPQLKVTAQGGVGTEAEHKFLIEHYQLDSVGWGSPFLLVPEATTVDLPTMEKLSSAQENDLYLSKISPLGVPFNNLKGNSKDLEKEIKALSGKPGSPCPKEYLSLNKDFTEKPICTASRQYQRLKLKELEKDSTSDSEFKKRFKEITEKACLCMGLGSATMQVNSLEKDAERKGVSVCPGPNMAYFNRTMSLKEITDHIYGRFNVLGDSDRPHVFLKELKLYLNYYQDKLEEVRSEMNQKQERFFSNFSKNLKNGILYYQDLFSGMKDSFKGNSEQILTDLKGYINALEELNRKMASKA